MIQKYALIIGAMKCGTTALYYALGQHPRVALSREKEPGFFSKDDVFERGMDWYRGLWDWDPSRHEWAVEASTSYSKLPIRRSAAHWANNTRAEFRFIYMVRNPIERIRSEFLHMLADDYRIRPVTEGIPPSMICVSNYWMQARVYEDYFGRDKLKVLSYARFREDPTAVTREVLQFLDLDPDEVQLRPPGPRNSSDLYLKKLLLKHAREAGLPAWEDPELMNQPFEQMVNAYAQRLGDRELVRLLTETLRHVRGLFVPTQKQAQDVVKRLVDDLGRFKDRYGVDAWTAG